MKWVSMFGLCCLWSIACAAAHGGGFDTTAGGASGADGDAAPSSGPVLDVGADGAVPNDGGSAASADPPPSPIAIDDCAGGNASGLSSADVGKLQAGGSSAELGYLYPYDGTVFPRGLIAPLLMWKGADTASGVYVHVHASLFDYKGCLQPTGQGQLQLPQSVWETAGTHTLGGKDPFSVELTVIDSGTVKGPIREQIVIAQATLKGSIYYNSYESKLSANPGAVLRIIPGKNAQLFLGGDHCTGCHAVSADGMRMMADHSGDGGDVIAITPTTAPMPTPLRTGALNSPFVGFAPNGHVYVVHPKPNGFGPRTDGNPPPAATLYETDTGNVIPDSGIAAGAIMTTFSVDGKQIVFNDYAIDGGHGLALMDYDPQARSASNYRVVLSSSDKLPGWPFSLPDDKAVVFAFGTASDFSGGNVGIQPIAGVPTGPWDTFISPPKGPYSNLFIISATGGTPVMLAKAMGYATEQDAVSGNSYLQFGAEELDQNYYPTVQPVSGGGYFWVFFDSYRHYGNLGLFRQLWGTAITVSATGDYSTDPSHPAFYLTGQEQGTGNHRAFTALDPCHADGASCSSGIDCCGGFCTAGKCTTGKGCARVEEACRTSADCCDTGNACLGGYCGTVLQ